MEAVVSKWGNAVGISIPQEAIENSNLQLNDKLEVLFFEGGIILQKVSATKHNKINVPLPCNHEKSRDAMFGYLRGEYKIANDFDAPLEDFMEYMQ